MLKKMSFKCSPQALGEIHRLLKYRNWSLRKLFEFAIGMAKIALAAHTRGNHIVLYSENGEPLYMINLGLDRVN